ncbi:olfactory receptor 6Q1-like [Phocoena sinus]|uniref:olfactory receptor 6Q1-like n=1 Tax=Phocoena sinus TaxID=42100 RepID=UPI0013C513D6|nr:olfactory receptor 6Q1-like [Phocoena sinus]
MTISYLVHKSAIWGRPSREDWCQRGQLDQGWRVDSSDDSFTWLACWCWLSVGDQPGLRTRDLNSSPPGPFCSDVTLKETTDFLVSLAVLLTSSTVIAVSYGNIVWTLLHIRLAAERRKAFSACAAHLTVVSLFYGTLFFMYVRTKVAPSINFNKVVSVFYSIVTPMLNPLIYSLRNKEVKGALGRAFSFRSWKGQ